MVASPSPPPPPIFQSDDHGVLCWPVECTAKWVGSPCSNERQCNFPNFIAAGMSSHQWMWAMTHGRFCSESTSLFGALLLLCSSLRSKHDGRSLCRMLFVTFWLPGRVIGGTLHYNLDQSIISPFFQIIRQGEALRGRIKEIYIEL